MMLCTVTKLRSYIEEGKVEKLFAIGSSEHGWSLFFETLSGRVQIRPRRKNEPKTFKSELSLFKFAESLGLLVEMINMKNKFESVATKIASLFMIAQINPIMTSVKDMCMAAAPAYRVILDEHHISISNDKPLVEHAMDYMTAPALFVVGINSSISELENEWQQPLLDILRLLMAMGEYDKKYDAHIKSIVNATEHLSI